MWGKDDPVEPPRFADKRHGQAEEGMKASDLAGFPRDPELADYRSGGGEIWGRKQDLPDLLFSELRASGSEW